MKKSKLPRTDSIAELAEFWDHHDISEFESELEEVAEPIFVRPGAIQLDLPPREAAAIKKLARAKGVSQEELVRSWILSRLTRSNGHSVKRRRSATRK
jgi:hypothetical protein